jgi:hypothetical protein
MCGQSFVVGSPPTMRSWAAAGTESSRKMAAVRPRFRVSTWAGFPADATVHSSGDMGEPRVDAFRHAAAGGWISADACPCSTPADATPPPAT